MREVVRSVGRQNIVKVFTVFMILVVQLATTGCRKQEEVAAPEPVKPVKLYAVKAGVEELQMSLPGRVRAAKRSELSFRVSGPLEDLPIDEGQLVKKGDLIAQIQKRDFETAVSEAKARELEAEQQYQRYKELFSKRQVSKADFDRYRAARDVARARLEDARNNLKDTTLVAPFDGVIARRYVENFEKVQEKQPIVFLQLIDRLEVLIDVPELLMAQFRQSEEIDVIASFESAPGKEYPLVVREFSTDADPATQTYQVVMTMEQPEEANILPGMTAKVVATGKEGADFGNNILVPAISVLNGADGTPYVFVYNKDSSTVTRVQVVIGPLEGTTSVTVTEGLEGGEEIVMAGVTKLRDGMRVRPWENQREGK